MKKRKMLSLFLVGCLAAGTLAGCGGKSNSGDSQSGSDQASSDFSKLKILGTEGWAPCNDWNEVEEYSAYQILKSWLDDAKLDIDWEVVAPEQYSVILQTRFASGKDLPDIAKAHTMDDAALMALAEQGLIIPINEIIDKYSQGPAKEAFDKKFPTIRPLTTAEDGNIYWFCNVSSKYYGDNTDPNGSFSMLYRRDWADKLGIAEPTNLEEFTQMLRDFREKDANGNGQQDEIMFIDPSSFRTSIAQWFDLPTDMIALDPVENKIVSPWNSPNVKPYFEYLNSLVQEGILDPSVAGNFELMAQKRAENKLGCLWDYTNAMWNEPTVAEIAPDALYAPLMPLPALDGVEPGSMSEPGSMVWERYVVTKDCEDLEAVARLLDIVYSDEYAVLTAFGQEGVNFTYEDGVMTPIPDLTADMAHEQRISEGAMLWNGVLPRVQEVDMRQQVANCDDYKRQVTLDLIDYNLKYPDQVNNFLALPTKEESDKINALLPNLQTASKELATKLTLGQISVDDLDKEVEKLEELGLSELVDIYQARYERYLANMPS